MWLVAMAWCGTLAAQPSSAQIDSAAVVHTLVSELVLRSRSMERSTEVVPRFELLQDAMGYDGLLADDSLRLVLYHEMAICLGDLELPAAAMGMTRRAVDLSEQQLEAPSAAHYRLLGLLAGQLVSLGHTDSAAVVYQRALDHAVQLQGPWAAAALNNLGMLAFRKGDTTLADRRYTSALRILDLGDRLDSILWISIRDNRADVDLARGHRSTFVARVDSNLHVLAAMGLQHAEVRNKYLGYRFKLMDHLIDTDPTAAHEAIADMAALLNDLGRSVDPTRRIELLERRFSLAMRLNDNAMIAGMAGRVLAVRDSLQTARMDRQAMVVGALATLSQQRLRDNMQAELRLVKARSLSERYQARMRTLLVAAVAALALLILLTVVLLERARKRRQALEHELVGFELEHKRKDVQALAMDLAQRQRATEKALELADALGEAKGKEARTLVDELREQMQAQVRVDHQREWLHREVEQVNSAFYQKLKEQYPDLAATEVELCGLIRAGLGNLEIAELRNISIDSARKARYRLKKRLGLDHDQDLVAELMAL